MRIRILLSLALAVLATSLAPDTFAQQLLYIHADHLNTPRLVTNGSGTPVWRWDQIEPFGDNLPNEDPDGNGTPGHMPLRFPGQYFDKETNLAYNYHRDYDSATGRYIQSDPIGLAGGLNTYTYVNLNPLMHVDPDGLFLPSLAVRTIQALITLGGGLAAGVAINSSGGDSPSNVIPFPVPQSDNDKSCRGSDSADDNFCKRNQESLLNRKKLILMMAAVGFKPSPATITGFNAEVRAHNLRCPMFRVDPIGPTIVK